MRNSIIMVCPYNENRGDGLQIWIIAAYMLNMQLWTASKGGPPAWELGKGLANHHKNHT